MGGDPTNPAHEARQPYGGRAATRTRRIAQATPVPEGDLPPLIFAGDLVRAVRALQPDDPGTLGEIAHVLGLVEAAAAASPAIEDVPVEPGSSPQPAPIVAPVDGGPSADPSSLTPGLVATVLKVADPVTTAVRPGWFASTEAMAAPAPAATRPPIDPLFVSRWTRAIISGSISIRSAEGPLDVDRIVDRLAQLMPLGSLPRLFRPTTRFGAQVLVDIGDAMMPWSRDVTQLRDAIVAVIGRDRCEMLQFEGCPLRGAGHGMRTTWTAYPAPVQSTPIVVLSDLGVGRPGSAVSRATPGEWLAFVDLARRAGAPVVAFVPYPSERVPAALRRAMTVVPWDRSTSIRDVHRRVGPGLAVAAR